MSRFTNNITVAGNVGVEPKLYTFTRKDGTEGTMARYYLIINQGKKSNGEDIVNAVGVSIFGVNAKNAVKYVKKGDCLGVNGELTSNFYERKNGKRNLEISILGEDIYFGKNFRCAYNNVNLTGRLVKDPSIINKNDNKIATFTISVNPRIYKEQNAKDVRGELFNITVFGEKQVNFVSEYLFKGMLVSINGKINSHSYKEDDENVYIVNVIAKSIDFAETKSHSNHVRQRQENKIKEEKENEENYLLSEYNKRYKNDNSNDENVNSDVETEDYFETSNNIGIDDKFDEDSFLEDCKDLLEGKE